MTKQTWTYAAVLAVTIPFAAAADDTIVEFKGGIGVHPVSNGNNAGVATTAANATDVARNIVRTVQPPGQPWVIADLSATVKSDGSIKVNGKGLLLAGGNNVGLNGGQSVFATLICEAAAPFTLRNTNLNGVPLQANGDFEIDDVLNPAPFDCASPVLLIRNLGGAWFAAGIPKLNENDH